MKLLYYSENSVLLLTRGLYHRTLFLRKALPDAVNEVPPQLLTKILIYSKVLSLPSYKSYSQELQKSPIINFLLSQLVSCGSYCPLCCLIFLSCSWIVSDAEQPNSSENVETVQVGYCLLTKEQINLLYSLWDFIELYPDNVFPDVTKQHQVTNRQGLKLSRNETCTCEELVKSE